MMHFRARWFWKVKDAIMIYHLSNIIAIIDHLKTLQKITARFNPYDSPFMIIVYIQLSENQNKLNRADKSDIFFFKYSNFLEKTCTYVEVIEPNQRYVSIHYYKLKAFKM